MKQKFIVFDVETPNYFNDRISSIGITVVENGIIVDELYSLINPETQFDRFNINLTGITPEMAANGPTFWEFWPEIESVMGSGVLIAHNAAFDMGVLSKCLSSYKISWKAYAEYACTCAMGRVCYPQLPNHKLDTLCKHLGISLNHHNAGSDSRACAELLIDYCSHGTLVDRFRRNYDFSKIPQSGKRIKSNHSEETEQLLELKTFLENITADGILENEEIFSLRRWLNINHFLKGNYPFDKAFETIEHVLADGIIDRNELESMINIFNEIIDPVSFVTVYNEIDIKGKIFCLTGEFDFGARSAVEKTLVQKGGISGKGVTRQTGYLIVGNKGSDAWSAGNYGNKFKKAMEMQDKGFNIRIIKEEDIGILLYK